MTCASFAHIDVISFSYCFIPKSSLALSDLQQFAFPWAVGAQSTPKALHLLLHGCILQGIFAFLDQAGQAVGLFDPDLGVSLAKVLQIYSKFHVVCMESHIYLWFNWAVHEVWIILK